MKRLNGAAVPLAGPPRAAGAPVARGSRAAGQGPLERLAAELGNGYETKFDRFELAQLREVAAACRESRTAAEAGKRLFAVSRKAKKTSNDTDRLAKYLAKFGLSFKALAARPS